MDLLEPTRISYTAIVSNSQISLTFYAICVAFKKSYGENELPQVVNLAIKIL